MTTIELENEGVCRPGETLRGRVKLAEGVASPGLELRVFWMTRGRGTEEVGVVESRELRDYEFAIELPDAPWSFSGALVGVVWAIELVDPDGEALAMAEFIMAPEGKELRLRKIPDPAHQERRKWMKRHL